MKKEELEQEEKRQEILKKAYEQVKERLNKKDNKAIVESLESKKNLTGQDLGQLFMIDIFNTIRALKNREQIQISKDLYNRYTETITKLDKENNDIFTTYRFLNIWLSNTYYISLAHIQQRTGKYNYLMGRIRDLYFTESIYNFYTTDFKELPEEKNNQKANEYKNFYLPFSLLRYTEENKNYKSNREHIREAINNTIQSYKYLVCFNKVMDILAEYYKLPDLELFKYDSIEFLPEEYEQYNKYVKILTEIIKGQTLTPRQKDNKLFLFKQLFQPINYSYKIPKYKVDNIKEQLSKTDFTLFANRKNDILNQLLN